MATKRVRTDREKTERQLNLDLLRTIRRGVREGWLRPSPLAELRKEYVKLEG